MCKLVRENVHALSAAMSGTMRRAETVEAAREEYKKLLQEGWKKTSIFNSYF